MSVRTVSAQSATCSQGGAPSVAYSVGPVESVAAISLAPAQSIAVSVQACEAPGPQAESRWADYSPEDVDLPFPALPEPDYKCYQPPTVPPGQTRYLNVELGTNLKNVNQNFNDVRTAVRENNTHVQRNKTQITQVNRNHNHLLRIVTNENNYEHNLTNKIVRVQDTHRQKIENVKGETRNFKDFKQTQKVEKLGCRNDGTIAVAAPEPAPQVCTEAPLARSISVVSRPATTVVSAVPAMTRVLAPSRQTEVRYLSGIQGSASTIRTVRA